MGRFHSHRYFHFGVVLMSVLWVAAAAQAIAINVTATVNGVPNTQLGSINATYAGGVEEGSFQLDNAQLGLMDDPDCQFRWFQIVTRDTDNTAGAPTYLGNMMNNSTPYVDPPKNGWDYQRNPAGDYTNGTPGADGSPFYENDDDAGNYAFPKYSGNFNVFGGNNNVPVHDANTGVSRTQDVPGTSPGFGLTFQTFLTFINACADHQIIVLAGYEWGLDRAANGTYTYFGPTAIDMSVDGFSDSLSTALTNGGFGNDGWSFAVNGYGENVVCCPEPASLALLGAGGIVLVRRRRAA